MKVFVTGASGYVGREVVDLLLAQGYTVVGQVRSNAKAEDFRKRGIEPVVCTLEDTDVLAKAASSVDAVIHTAFDHAGPSYLGAVEKDVAATHAMTAALEGTNKVFMSSSGTGVTGDTGLAPVDEQFPVDLKFPMNTRSPAEREVILAAGKGVRAMVMRLPPYVWGKGGSYFIPVQLESAARLGKAYYILPGTQKSTAVHVEDAARAYVLALEHGKAGHIYNITSNWDFTNKEIAEAVGANTGVPVEGITFEEACAKETWAEWLCIMFGLNTRSSGAKAAKELGWTAKQLDVLADVVSGSYKH